MEREDADSRTLELGSDLIMGLWGLKMDVAGTDQVRSPLQGDVLNLRLGGVKSVNVDALDSLASIEHGVKSSRCMNGVPSRGQTGFTNEEEMNEGLLGFTTPESSAQFFAKKILDSYNEYYQLAMLVLEEGIACEELVSGGMAYIHINCKVKDLDGNEHLFFAEATIDEQPILITHCILERGDTGDYCHHQIGCGWCDPDSSVPMYHPRRGYLHGDKPPAMGV